MAKNNSAGIHHGEHGEEIGASKARYEEPYAKVVGLNKPVAGHQGSHDSVAREHGRELKTEDPQPKSTKPWMRGGK